MTLPDGRVRHVKNAYVAGPALVPDHRLTKPNADTGVALARRLGDQLASSQRFQAEPGFTVLFDGFDTSKWGMTTIHNQAPDRSNPGGMRVLRGALETMPGNDLGLYWCTLKTPENFILRLQWLRWHDDANSGVFVRFPDPESKGYNNSAYVPVDFGFEVQIDERGAPDGAPIHRTGAIYRGRQPHRRRDAQPEARARRRRVERLRDPRARSAVYGSAQWRAGLLL